MSRRGNVEVVLSKAQALEKKYDWLEAAALYEQALGMLAEDDFSRKGGIQERSGYCFHKAAFQADAKEEFKERMQQSVESYEKAAEFYGKPSKESKMAWVHRCEAMVAYNGYWLASEAAEKKRLINECWRLTKEALKVFEDAKAALEYGKTFNQLSPSAYLAYVFEWSFQTREKIIKEALEHGERTIILLSKVSASHELAQAYVKTASYLSDFAWCFASDMDEKENYYRKGLGYWQKAMEISEETSFLELLSMPGESLDWTIDEMLIQFGKALGYAKKTRDKYLIGIALDNLKYATLWTMPLLEDPDKKREVSEEALKYAKDAMHQFSIVSFVSPYYINWIEAPYAEYYQRLALLEIDLSKKRGLWEKAIIEYAAAVKQAESLGYPDVIKSEHHELGVCLVSLAKIETNLEEKRKLLESADEHIKEEMKLREQLERFNYWNLGMSWHSLSNLKTELSKIEKDDEKKKGMLEEAVSCQERALQLCVKYGLYREKKGDLTHIVPLGSGQYMYGERLGLLYGLTHDDEVQRKALKAFKGSAELFQKVNIVSRVAESCWKVATSYDTLGEHLKAAESFSTASHNYKNAAEKIPQLKSFYEDHAKYMEAWSEIENARHNHGRKEYGKAKEYYEKAADLHKSTERWNYLSANYLAWSQLEAAEDLSRKEQTEEARSLFQQAANLLEEAKKAIQARPAEAESPDETEMLKKIAKALDIRREYCLGRIDLEEARILDKQGDHAASSEKYGSAAEKFQKATAAMQEETDRQELKPIACLSRAWQIMTRAEAEVSPNLYSEAARLFEEAKELSQDENAKGLALGHSRFCKALEAGMTFEDTGDAAMYSEAKRHLEAAEKHYLKAGFGNASEYAKATHILFDAYMYTHNAETELDPTKKAQYYHMAEKFLQASAGAYMKAKHPEKSEEVGRLLESVKEKRQLAISLSEVLHAPEITSTTSSFSTPTPTQEQAVGLDRFENADVQANVLLRVKEAKVGEDVDFRLELVNAGKSPALLIKVDEIMPEGFEIKEVPEVYTVEDSYLNLKGKRLNPLKTEDVKIVVKPEAKGTYVIKPRILYIDETGKYKSHEPEPVTLTVKELGIKGWIKGEK